MGQYKAVILAFTFLLIIAIIGLDPVAEAKVTVHSVTITTDKNTYTLGSEAIAKALLDFTGAKKDLLGVNFTWYYPNGSIAKLDSNVLPDGTGTAYSSWWPDVLGINFIANATYTGDETKYDDSSFDVVVSPPYKEVSGPIGVDTTWTFAEGPYIVVDDVFVENGVTLTIEPGVVVEFKNNTALIVNGTIVARGGETNMITFTSNNSNPQPGDWESIEFNYADSGSEISYARIEYSKYGIYIFNSSPEITHNLIRDVERDGIRVYKSSSYIAYNTITNIVYDYGSNKGINLLGDCDVTIYRNVITAVQEYGIKIMNSEPVIDGNFISKSLYNIECDNSNATIVNNTILDAVDGIRIVNSLGVLLANNTISGNTNKGIRSESSSPRIHNNLISDNGDSAIWLYRSKDADVLDNIMEGNKNGVHAWNSDTSFIFGNTVINSTEDGFYIDDSFGLEFVDNTIVGNEDGIHLKDSYNIIMTKNAILESTEKALFAYNSSDFLMEKNTVASNKMGIYLHSATGTMANSTLSDNPGRDIYLMQNSRLMAINSTLDEQKILVLGGSDLIVKNYLHIFVQNHTYEPFQGVRVNITDNDVLVYSIQTDDRGMSRFLLLTDRVYPGSNTPIENVSIVEVDNSNVYLIDNPREVDMSISHLELFSPGNPLSLVINSPENHSLVFDVLNITGAALSLGGQMDKVEVRVDGGDWGPAMLIGEDWSGWWYELDTKTLSDGWHVILARVSSLHHEKEIFIEVLVDNIGNKPPFVSVTSHDSNDTVNGTIILEGSTFDYDGVVDSVEVRIDNGSWITSSNLAGNWSSWSINIDTIDYTDGLHNITVMAIDNATESMIINIVLVFDNYGEDGEDGEGGVEEEGMSRALGILLVLLIVIIVIVMIFIVLWKKLGKEEE